MMPLARVLACGHTAPPGEDCPTCGPTPAKRAESQRKRSKQSYLEVYGTPRWRAKRLEILKRYRFQCQLQMPGCTGRATQAAHIRPFTSGSDPLAWADDNLVASCRECNSREASQRWHATKEATDASQIQETSSTHGHGRSRQKETTWAY